MSGSEGPLRLLSLDGGGVRGLSSLLILQHIMRTVDPTNPPKPCDYFDLIGGTSTGGLIAIMLGRLKMDIEACIEAYLQISKDVFQPRKRKFDLLGRANDALKVRGRFNSEALKWGIQRIVAQAGENEEAKLRVEAHLKCRVFVCATRGEMGLHTALLRNYDSRRPEEVDCAIWEAGRATSAASSFFDPIQTGRFQETFVDGGTGCNNPVDKVFEEALEIWGEGARERINWFLSIGTGQPTERGFGNGLKQIASTVIHISTETEQTATRFARVNAPFLGAASQRKNIYFRFNVAKGLEEIGLERHEDKAKIAAATKVYLSSPQISSDLIACAGALRSYLEPIEITKEPTDPKDTIHIRSSADANSPDLIRECLRSLAFHEMDARLHGIERADKETCEWIFGTTQFRNWESRVDIASHNGVLWIKGKPGAGKSTLMKRIWLRLRKEANDSILAAFFFHGRGSNPLEKSALGMLRSILYQLLDQSRQLCAAFLPIFLDKKKKHGNDIPWYFGELKSFLACSAGNLGSNRIWLLVDALDECATEEVQSVVSILESLACSAIESHTALNICLASRHYPQIQMSKVAELVVEAHREHDQDIREYVRNNLIVNDPSIETEILTKSAHVFLWVKLVVKMLNKASVDGRVRAMMQILCNVPDDLDDLYCELLTKERNPDELRESVYMLQWVLFAKKELRPEQLYFAVLSGTDPGNLGPWDQQKEESSTIQRCIKSTSRGLIEVSTVVNIESDVESDVDSADSDWNRYRPEVGETTAVKVQFIHESVRDFLLSTKGLQLLDSSLDQQLVGNSHGRLASCCYSCIMMTNLESLERDTANHEEEVEEWTEEELEQSYPFLLYAGKFILQHMEDAEMGGVSKLELLKKLQPGSKGIRRLRRSNEILDVDYGLWTNGAEVMHVAAEMGLYEIFRRSLEEIKVNVGIVGGSWGTALRAAAARGHEKIVQLCLDHGADVNTVSGQNGTALQAAVAGGHDKVVQLLLEHEADVNTFSGPYSIALQAAARWGCEKIVQLLLDHGADVNIVGGYYGTALQAVTERGHEKIVQLLLEHGADVNIASGYYGTALQAATERGHEKIVQLLLEHGADVNITRGDHYGTALQAAAERGHEKIVQLLLEHGADVNITGGDYYTALHAAVWRNFEPIARTLLEYGADVNARDCRQGTALDLSRRCYNQACIYLLLEYGAEDIEEHPNSETVSTGAEAEAEAESE